MVGLKISITLEMRKRHAVISRDHHDGVFEQAAFFQFGEHQAKMLVKMFRLERIIKHIVSHLLVVRPAQWHAINVRKFFAAFGNSRTEFVRAMRFASAIPKKPRLVLRRRVEKIGEICCVIIVRYIWCRRDEFMIFVGLPDHFAQDSGRVRRDARRPTLARHAGEVTVLAHRLGK